MTCTLFAKEGGCWRVVDEAMGPIERSCGILGEEVGEETAAKVGEDEEVEARGGSLGLEAREVFGFLILLVASCLEGHVGWVVQKGDGGEVDCGFTMRSR